MLVQLQGPPLSNPTCLPTCIYINYIYCIHHLLTPPTSYPTAPATTRPPPLLLTPGVHHTPRRPRPRRPAPAPPCPAVKEPATDLATLIDTPIFDYRKRKKVPQRVPPSVFADLSLCQAGLSRHARSVPSSYTRSMRSDTAFITTAFLLTALTTTVSAFPVFAPQGTHHALKAATPPPLACPPARTCPPTSALANHSSLVLLPRPAAARHDPHAPAARCAATNAPPPRYALLPCALLATMQHASKTVDCMT